MGWQDGTPVADASPAWARAPAVEPDMSAVREHFRGVQARAATSFTDYLDAGWQQGVTGLATRGKAPDVALDESAPWYGRLAASVATIAGDVPAMIPGFMAGAPAGAAVGSAVPVIGTAVGGVLGGFAGAGALPAGLRAAMMEAYTKGEVVSASDFIDRSLHVAWETAKGGIVGAAMGGAGVAAKAALPVATGTAGAVARGVAITGAEVTAMATVASGLEGKLPEPQDFMDAAVLLGGLKGAAATAVKLRTIYAKTGKEPAEVLADAARDPEIAAELKTPGAMIEIPAAYKPAATAEAVRAAIPGFDAAAVVERPFALELPQGKGEPAKSTHVNYNYLNSSEEVAGALARLSEMNEQGIQGQRRGTVSWEETSAETAKLLTETLGGGDARLVMPREPGTAAGAAELLARKQMTIGAAEDMATRAKAFLERGTEASPEETVAFIASIERAAMIQAEFLGARAEAGRALNVLKSTARDAERAKLIKDVIDQYGGDPVALAEMIKDIDNPAAAMRFAKEATKATTWEKFIEYWKSIGMLSGPITHARNILGNGSFMVARPVLDAVAAGFGKLHGGERVSAMEPAARIIGNIQGAADAARAAMMVIKLGEETGAKSKVEQHRKAIEGTAGEIVRLPFRFLSASDVFFRTLNERGEGYSLAVRQATAEGLHPLTGEFRGRVAELLNDPPPAMAEAMTKAGERMTFQAELGEGGQKFQSMVRSFKLEWLFPFIKTPANILKETARLTPFAPFIKEWRLDVEKGGAARDKAFAELASGTAFMGLFFTLAQNGDITGAGPPDPGKRAAWSAAGNQPYSVKRGNEWHSYMGWGPLTTLVGIAADMSVAWEHMGEDDRDKLPKILAVAFANAVTNQTALMGMTNLVNVTSDPTRYGPRFINSLAAPVVPAIVAQSAAMMDPFVRQVDSVFDQIKSRIPGVREELLPKRDAFGEPIETKERLGAISPITITTESTDKVRLEAARLGVSVPPPPKKVHIGRGTGKIGDVKISPEQRDVYSQVAGQTAAAILAPVVNGAGWDDIPDLVKRKAFERAFTAAHKVGAVAALKDEERDAALADIQLKFERELAK